MATVFQARPDARFRDNGKHQKKEMLKNVSRVQFSWRQYKPQSNLEEKDNPIILKDDF